MATMTQRAARQVAENSGGMSEKDTKTTTKKMTERSSEIDILEVHRGIVEVCVIGCSPLICNRMSEKAMREILCPRPGRMNNAERASNLKHDPVKEFRDSPYRNMDEGPTRLQGLASWFHQAMMQATLDQPNTKKAQIGRLTYVLGERVDIYGTPQIMMAITRNSDIRRTPDVRTRAILPHWACKVKISYQQPICNQSAVTKLLAAAGDSAGVGDWRVGKGSGNYGRFKLVNPDDAEFLSILKEGRAVQDEALRNPTSYDDETYSLLAWFNTELIKRGKEKEVSIAAD